jgi:hypothetical protein
MATKPPERNEYLVNENRTPTRRTHRYFVEITDLLENYEMPAIVDVDIVTPTAAENAAKINELLAALRTAGKLES